MFNISSAGTGGIAVCLCVEVGARKLPMQYLSGETDKALKDDS